MKMISTDVTYSASVQLDYGAFVMFFTPKKK